MQSIFPSNSLRPLHVPGTGTPDYPLKIEVPYYPEIPFGSDTRIETRPADSRALVDEMIAKSSMAYRSAEYDLEDIGPVRTPSGVSTPSTTKLNSSSSSIFSQQWPGSIALQEMASPPRENKACQRYFTHECTSILYVYISCLHIFIYVYNHTYIYVCIHVYMCMYTYAYTFVIINVDAFSNS